MVMNIICNNYVCVYMRVLCVSGFEDVRTFVVWILCLNRVGGSFSLMPKYHETWTELRVLLLLSSFMSTPAPAPPFTTLTLFFNLTVVKSANEEVALGVTMADLSIVLLPADFWRRLPSSLLSPDSVLLDLWTRRFLENLDAAFIAGSKFLGPPDFGIMVDTGIGAMAVKARRC